MLLSISEKTELFGVNVPFEPEINREASEYLTDNYKELIQYIIKSIGIKEDKAYDLLHDVYTSLVVQEDNLEGFDETYISSKIEVEKMTRGIDVKEFVRGRIAGYAKNMKYRDGYVEGFIREARKDNNCTAAENKVKIGTPIYVVPASIELGDSDNSTENLSEYEMCYALASSTDNLTDIDQYMSIREEIEYCINVCNTEKIEIKNILLNLSTLDELLSGVKGATAVNRMIFSKLRSIIKSNKQFAEAFISVVEFASGDENSFRRLVADF